MRRSFIWTLLAFAGVLSVACHKNTSGPNPGHGPNSLFPLTAGDTWYFQDSAFTDSGQWEAHLDTMVATKNMWTDPGSGTIFLGLQDGPYGWFDSSYIAVDPSNYAVYEADAPNYQPYILLQTVSQDGAVSSDGDYSNPACVIGSTQYGYAAPVSLYGYQAYKNVEVVKDCNNIVLEEVVTYLSPGVGPVRMEDWRTDTTGGKNIFYETYSATLVGKSLH
jgi:hypothetical protein